MTQKVIKFIIQLISFYLILILVQGDYWHANPLIYKDLSKLSGVQRNNINRDRRKKQSIINELNYKYFVIWEYDIRNNNESFKKFQEDIKCLVQK